LAKIYRRSHSKSTKNQIHYRKKSKFFGWTNKYAKKPIMNTEPTLFYIIIGILVALLILSSYIIRNLLVKTEQYEDVTQNQVKYLQNISDLIGESKQHLQTLDEKGVFQSDDEVGEFFNQMKEVQEQLNNYMLPQNYGKEKSES
jgi:hypothetical protein